MLKYLIQFVSLFSVKNILTQRRSQFLFWLRIKYEFLEDLAFVHHGVNISSTHRTTRPLFFFFT